MLLWVATGAQNPTVDKAILNLKPLLILDLSIPKNVNKDVEELEGVTLIHGLFVATRKTLEKRIFLQLKLSLKQSKRAMFGPKVESLHQQLLP
jgi:predicted amino acid dehydrogenase